MKFSRKQLKFFVSGLAAIFILLFVCYAYNDFLGANENMADLKQKCNESLHAECCIKSVLQMIRKSGRLTTLDDSCPKGEKENFLSCEGSLHWCEKE